MGILSGANALIAMKKEATYGTPPSGNWEYIPIVSFNLAERQTFSDNDLVGQGSDTLRPTRELSEYTGEAVVAVDVRALGHWLTAAFGSPTTTDSAAEGYITFSAQPADDSTITLNGVTWTFKASGASGNQSNKGASLSLTLDALVTALNASANGSLTPATYSKVGTTQLKILYDTTGTGGNAYTLAASAASNGTVSYPTLQQGGKKHFWTSGGTSLPSFSIERQHPDGTGGTLYAVYKGVKVDGFTINLEPTGRSTISFQLQAKGIDRAQGSSAAGTPTTINVTRFSQYGNYILKDGVALAKVVQATIPYALNNELIRYVGGAGEIGDIVPGIRTSNGQLVTRFQDWSLFDIAKLQSTFALEGGFNLPGTGFKLAIGLDQVEIGNPSDPINGPAGIQATFPLIASRNSVSERMMGVTLYNDVAGY